MFDRLDAIGGSLRIESSAAAGTTITGILPVGSSLADGIGG
jgi:signal transduction histidine kinase